MDPESEAPEVCKSRLRSTGEVTSVPVSIYPMLRYSEELILALGAGCYPTYTGLCGGLERLKIETRLIDEKLKIETRLIDEKLGECVI